MSNDTALWHVRRWHKRQGQRLHAHTRGGFFIVYQ